MLDMIRLLDLLYLYCFFDTGPSPETIDLWQANVSNSKTETKQIQSGIGDFRRRLCCVLFDFFSYNIPSETDPRYLFKNVEINICFFREIHSFSQH